MSASEPAKLVLNDPSTNWKESTLRSASRLTLCGAIFDAPARRAQLAKTEEQINAPDFWVQPEKSQKVMQDRKRLEEQIAQDSKIAALTSDLDTLFELAREGENVNGDLEREMQSFTGYLAKLETQMLLSGENDARSAIVTIHPGAGGTESQDWAEMLLRMYLRWAERNRFETVVTDRLEGEGAGIKSVTFEVNGENAYGLLQSEVGVHRLVRISPFDANARRHTSFASVFVYPQIDDEITIDIRPDDLRIDTFRSGGAGGQHVNRTDSAVRMTHLPTNIVVQCQNERSQHKNRASAMKVLRSRMLDLEMQKQKDAIARDRKSQVGTGERSEKIRTYNFPQNRVTDHRVNLTIHRLPAILEGDLDPLIEPIVAHYQAEALKEEVKV